MTTSDHLLNHVELFHRPGEGALAVTFFETIGCTVIDITKAFGASSTYYCVFPGKGEADPLNNVLYVSQVRGEHPLEVLFESRQDDPEVAAALEQCTAMRSTPGKASHFGLRYPTFDDVEAAFDRVQNQLPAELAGRVTTVAPFPLTLGELGTEVIQGFVHTDVVGTGLFPFGQLIELQAQRPLT